MALKKSKIERPCGIRCESDQREIANVYVRAFGNPGLMESHLYESLFKAPIYNPEHTRIVFADGKAVSGVTMAPRTMRFGPVYVPAMTLGPVGTHDHYRKRGYGSAAMRDACRYMEAEGVLIAYLQGIEDFYHRFGFFPYMAPCVIKINRKKAEKEAAPGHLRLMRKSDLPAVSRIYSRVTSSRIGPAFRTKTLWNWLLESAANTWLFRSPKVIIGGDGKLCGYITVERDARLGEVVVRPAESAFRTAIGAIVRYAKKLEEKEISFPAPWDDGFAGFVRQHVSAEVTFRSSSTGGPLMKIIDFPSLMIRLEPLLQSRWRRSAVLTDYAQITMRSDIGKTDLFLSPKNLRVRRTLKNGSTAEAQEASSFRMIEARRRFVVRIPSRWLSGLLTGYHSVSALRLKDEVTIPRDAADLMNVLFPSGWPFVYQGDNY